MLNAEIFLHKLLVAERYDVEVVAVRVRVACGPFVYEVAVVDIVAVLLHIFGEHAVEYVPVLSVAVPDLMEHFLARGVQKREGQRLVLFLVAIRIERHAPRIDYRGIVVPVDIIRPGSVGDTHDPAVPSATNSCAILYGTLCITTARALPASG